MPVASACSADVDAVSVYLSSQDPAGAGPSHMRSVPHTPDGKHIKGAKLVGAGFKPVPVPQARCERIAVISCAIEVRTA
jgi:hypothetical protein